jgi:hypothetical protein
LNISRALLPNVDKVLRVRRTAHAITKLSRRQINRGATGPILCINMPKQQPPIQPFIPLHRFD